MEDKELNIKPWERQPYEGSLAFKAFQMFRDMNKRNKQEVAEQINRSHGWVRNIAKKWKWEERIKAYDDYMDKLRLEAKEEEIQEMIRRHIQQSLLFQKSLVLPAEALLNRIQPDSDPDAENRNFAMIPFDKLFDKVLAAAQVFSKIVDVERKSRGEPNEITKNNITTNDQTIRVILPKLPVSTDENEGE